jgi:hypothetical protein
MAQPLPPKSSLSTVDRIIDWSPELGGDAITSTVFTLTSGTVTLSGEGFSANQTAVTIAGGAIGETAVIHNQITTEGGQTLEGDFSIYVEAAIGPWGPSTATKGLLVEMAYEEVGSAGYSFDHGPDEKASTLRKLDVLMASPVMPVIGYNAPAVVGGSDMLDAAGIPDSALQTVAIELGVRIAPSWGKTMSPETRKARNEGMNALRTMASSIPSMPLRAGTPIGSGNRWRSLWRPFVRRGDSATVFVAS